MDETERRGAGQERVVANASGALLALPTRWSRGLHMLVCLALPIAVVFATMVVVLSAALLLSWPERFAEITGAPLERLGTVALENRSERRKVGLVGVRWSCDRTVAHAPYVLVPGVAEEGGRLVFARLSGALTGACAAALREPRGVLCEIPDHHSDGLRAHGLDVITTPGGWPLYFEVVDADELRREPEMLRFNAGVGSIVTVAGLGVGFFRRRWFVRVMGGGPFNPDQVFPVSVPARGGGDEVVEARVLHTDLASRIDACGHDCSAFERLARACMGAGYNDAAFRVARDFVRAFPNEGISWATLVESTARSGCIREAKQTLDLWETRLGRSDWTRIIAAKTAEFGGMHAEGAAITSEMLDVNPNHGYALETLIRCWTAAGRTDLWRQRLESLAQRDDAWRVRVALFVLAPDESTRSVWLAQILSIAERSPALVSPICLVLTEQGAFHDAVAMFGPAYDPTRHGIEAGFQFIYGYAYRDQRGLAQPFVDALRGLKDPAVDRTIEHALGGPPGNRGA